MSAAERDAARDDLVAFLGDLRRSGRPVPCIEPTRVDVAAFTSDDEDRQRYAARLCVGCAGATTCGNYGTRYPKEFGVYGGATTSERQPRRGRPTKTSSDGAAA